MTILVPTTKMQQFKMATLPPLDADNVTPREIVKEVRLPLEWDYWIYRIVVTTLGLAVLGAVGGSIYLSAAGKSPIPEVVVALGSAAVGVLAGLIAPPSSPSEQRGNVTSGRQR